MMGHRLWWSFHPDRMPWEKRKRERSKVEPFMWYGDFTSLLSNKSGWLQTFRNCMTRFMREEVADCAWVEEAPADCIRSSMEILLRRPWYRAFCR